MIAVLAVHACLLAAAITWRYSGPQENLIEEIPVEIVIEATPAAAEPALAPARQEIFEPPLTDVAAQASDVVAPSDVAAQPSDAVAQPPAPIVEQSDEPTPPLVAVVAAPPPQSVSAINQAEEAERNRRDDLARRRAARIAEEKADVERERRAMARRAEEREKRAQAAHASQRLAALEPQQRVARAAPAAAFDAAAYRAVVARAVSGAVSRSCPASGGGRVVVALLIGASGRIDSASLSSASGNSALDSAAIAAVRRAGPFPAPSSRSSVSVPVVVICR